jgi:ribosome biogenesis GTPase
MPASPALLAQLPDWQIDGNRLVREFLFRDYHETIEFVNALAFMVHREDHHPDLQVGYRRCTASWTTHSAGHRLSENDFICAAKADALYAGTSRRMSKNNEMTGTIVAAHGRHYLADVGGAQSKFLQCVTRGKKTNVAVGDIVHLKRTSNDQAVIEKIAERTTLLYRSDQYKSKLLAANITRLFIVIATEPGFADDLVSRSLVACEAAGVEAHLILNKVDVTRAAGARARARGAVREPRLSAARSLGQDRSRRRRRRLMPLLAGQSSIFIGQSGMGKSSLINLLVPDADIAVREISAALDTGKHTTTFTRLYRAGHGRWRRPDHRLAGLPGIRPVPPDRRHAGTRLRRVQALPGRLQVLQLPPPGRAAVRGAGGGRRRQDREDPARAVCAAAARIRTDLY